MLSSVSPGSKFDTPNDASSPPLSSALWKLHDIPLNDDPFAELLKIVSKQFLSLKNENDFEIWTSMSKKKHGEKYSSITFSFICFGFEGIQWKNIEPRIHEP